MLKKSSDVPVVSAKTKSKPKTFQTPENAMRSETDSFDKNFYGIVNREISSQLLANIYRGVWEVGTRGLLWVQASKYRLLNFQSCF